MSVVNHEVCPLETGDSLEHSWRVNNRYELQNATSKRVHAPTNQIQYKNFYLNEYNTQRNINKIMTLLFKKNISLLIKK